MDQSWMVVASPHGAARDISLACYAALQQMGKRVVLFDSLKSSDQIKSQLLPQFHDHAYDWMDYQLISRVVENQVTHFFTGGLAPVGAFVLKNLAVLGVQRIHWFYEDYRLVQYYKELAPFYDCFACVQKGDLLYEVPKRGGKYYYLPNGGPSVAEKKEWDSRLDTVAFVGVPSAYRIQILEALHQGGVSLQIAGEGWGNYQGCLKSSIVHPHWISREESFQVYQNAKVVLCLGQTPPEMDQQVSPRIFEVLANGAWAISDQTPLQLEILPEVPQFQKVEELLKQVQYALASKPKDLSGLSEYVSSNHSIQARLEQLLTHLGLA